MPPFFGLTSKYSEQVYEEIFYLKYYGGWSIFESYNLPVGLRRWFVRRLSKQIESENEARKEAHSKASGGKGTQTL